MTELQRVLLEFDQRLSALESARVANDEKDANNLLTESDKFLGSLVDKTKAYMNVIIISGYASAFTIWSFTRSFLARESTIIVALLLLFSITIFVFWEVVSMSLAMYSISRLHTVPSGAGPAEHLAAVKEVQSKNHKLNLSLFRWWQGVSLATVGSALLAILVLGYHFCLKLFA